MIDIKLLEKKSENNEVSYLDKYRANLVHRSADTAVLEKILELNKKRKELIFSAETEKAKQKKASEQLGQLKREGKDTTSLQADLGKISAEVKEMEKMAADVDASVYQLLLTIPNLHHESVPVGSSAQENKITNTVGAKTSFSFKAKEHWELGEKLGIIDFERASKVTGTRFAFLKGHGARLERALIQFMMDLHSDTHGYTEMIPPFIVNSQSLTGTGNLPKFKDDLFHLSGSDYFLIPTAEVPVTNYYHGEVLNESDLPKMFCAYSPCFRSEAGSHGRDTKGLIRQHQFNKVELMIFALPSKSHELHEKLTSDAENVLKVLELPFRRMLLCTGDMGFGSAKTFDLEVWLPGQNEYREISSCSNFEDFQSRRANIRYKSATTGKPQFLHTINGSGLAVGRTLIAILENYQNEDGTVRVPKALHKYMNGVTLLK